MKIRYKTILESPGAVGSTLEAALPVQGLPKTAVQPYSWCESQTDLRDGGSRSSEDSQEKLLLNAANLSKGFH